MFAIIKDLLYNDYNIKNETDWRVEKVKKVAISLSTYLKNYVRNLGLPTDFTINLKGYSKDLSGRYNPNTRTIIIYHHKNSHSNAVIDMNSLKRIVIHEAVHHYQWVHSQFFIRLPGVMHNKEFYMLEAFMKLGKPDPVEYADKEGPTTWRMVTNHVKQILENHANI